MIRILCNPLQFSFISISAVDKINGRQILFYTMHKEPGPKIMLRYKLRYIYIRIYLQIDEEIIRINIYCETL